LRKKKAKPTTSYDRGYHEGKGEKGKKKKKGKDSKRVAAGVRENK